MSKASSNRVSAPEPIVRNDPLLGRCDHALDPKKRLTIPSHWRRSMGDPEYVYVMPDRSKDCLNVLPPVEMERRLDQLRAKSISNPEQKSLLRAIGAASEQLTLDVQGRIRIGDALLDYAHLDGKVAMIGGMRAIELWNPSALGPEGKVDKDAFRAAMEALDF